MNGSMFEPPESLWGGMWPLRTTESLPDCCVVRSSVHEAPLEVTT